MAPGDFVHLLLEPPREPLLIPPPSPQRLVQLQESQRQVWLDVATELARASRSLAWLLMQATDATNVAGDITPELHLQTPRLPALLAAADDFHAAYRVVQLYLAWMVRVKKCAEARLERLAGVQTQEEADAYTDEHGMLVALASILERGVATLGMLARAFSAAARHKQWHLTRVFDIVEHWNDLVAVFVMMM
jgi:hypothetical protein